MISLVMIWYYLNQSNIIFIMKYKMSKTFYRCDLILNYQVVWITYFFQSFYYNFMFWCLRNVILMKHFFREVELKQKIEIKSRMVPYGRRALQTKIDHALCAISKFPTLFWKTIIYLEAKCLRNSIMTLIEI